MAANRALEAPDRRRAGPVALGRGGLGQEVPVGARRRVPGRRPRGPGGALGALQPEVEGDACRGGGGGREQRDQREGGCRPVPHRPHPTGVNGRSGAPPSCRRPSPTGRGAGRRSRPPGRRSRGRRPGANLGAWPSPIRSLAERKPGSRSPAPAIASGPRARPPPSARGAGGAGRVAGARARADPLRPHARLAVRLLPRRGGDHGRRPGADARRPGSTAQLCGDAHLSNFGVFAAPDRAPRLRHQRLRRDASRPVRVGRQAPRGQLRDRRARAAASPRRSAARSRSPRSRAYREAMRAVRRHERPGRLVRAARRRGLAATAAGRASSKKRLQGAREGRGQGPEQGQRAGARASSPSASTDERRIVSDPPLIVPIEELFAAERGAIERDAARRLDAAYRRTPPRATAGMLARAVPTTSHAARKVVGVGSVGHPRLDHPAARARRRRPAVPPGQGGAALGARAVRGHEPVRATRATGWSRASA